MDFPLRQMEMASRLAGGATVEPTGAGLGLKPSTARNYIRLIYARLGVADCEGLTRALAGG